MFAHLFRFGGVLGDEYSYKLKRLHVKPHQSLMYFKVVKDPELAIPAVYILDSVD